MSRKPGGPDSDIASLKGLPWSLDAERFALGSILLDGDKFPEASAVIETADFALEKHRRIFARMALLASRNERIDRVTVANELLRYNELASVDGLSYLVSLDDGLPNISNLDGYLRLIKDKSSLRRIVAACQHAVNRALLAQESPEEIIASIGDAVGSIGESRQVAGEGLQGAGDFLSAFPGGLQRFVSPAQRENGIRTGFAKLDEMTGGFRPGELIIVGGRPGHGKSAISANVAWNVATMFNKPAAMFSLEMSRESLLLRMLCGAARVDSQRLRSGYVNREEIAKIRSAANRMMEAPIYIDDSPNVTLVDVEVRLRRLEKSLKRKVELVVIDYLQLMAGANQSENRTQEVSKLSRGLKLLSKKLDCPFLVLSQLSRESEKRAGVQRPQLSDLRESGSIEQDADVVLFVFQEWMYKRDREDLRGLAELIVAKQRSGPCGIVNLVWLAGQTRFENRAEDLGPAEEGNLPYADE